MPKNKGGTHHVDPISEHRDHLRSAARHRGSRFAADEPKTKADCDKAKGKWDDKTSKCTVKK